MDEVPYTLTVEEAAAILRISRSVAYAMANRWIDTGGEDGFPARHVGRLIRVPTGQFEEFYGIRITWRRGSLVRKSPEAAPGPEPAGPVPPSPVPPSPAPVEHRKRPRRSNQTAFPFPG